MKVLIISHNPVSTHNNMGKTFLSLFSSFPKETLCQLFVHPSLPDVDVCHAYYRITDREALKSVYTRKAPGREITGDMRTSEPAVASSQRPQSAAPIKNKSSAVARLGRDLVWKLSRWYAKPLKAWLDRERPTCIFLAPGYARFIYDIALKIARDRQIPIVTYICDDYYFVNFPAFLSGRLQLKLLKKKTKALMKQTACLVGICDEIKDSYHDAFGVTAVKLMTGSSFPVNTISREDVPPQTISYFGNIRCRRYVSLGDIGSAIEELNREKGTTFTLKIYTSEQDPAILNSLKECTAIELCDFVTGDAFDKAMGEADLLLHTEAFDAESIDLVKHSMSTKIADSLSSGIPLVAYGPAEVASIKHLMDNECAITATSREQLKSVLEEAFFNADRRIATVARAKETAMLYHDSQKNSQVLQKLLLEQ